MNEIFDVRSLKVLDDYILEVVFEDGVFRTVDVSNILKRKAFKRIRTAENFRDSCGFGFTDCYMGFWSRY